MQFRELITRLSTARIFAKLQLVCKDFRATAAANCCVRTDHRQLFIMEKDPYCDTFATALATDTATEHRRLDGLKISIKGDYAIYGMRKLNKPVGMFAHYTGKVLTICGMTLDGRTDFSREFVHRFGDGSDVYPNFGDDSWPKIFKQSGYKIDKNFHQSKQSARSN